ncbi:MAG: hypothetical protein IPP40_15810 [bacterium]|nr:hypothetical protein [bacterium]
MKDRTVFFDLEDRVRLPAPDRGTRSKCSSACQASGQPFKTAVRQGLAV